MSRALRVLAPILVLTFALMLAACGGSENGADAPEGDDRPAFEIADERLIGEWTSPDDGDVRFREDGIIVLSDGTEYPFTMPSTDRIDITFPGGTATYNVTWDGDDRHGVLASDSTTTTPTWYDRK